MDHNVDLAPHSEHSTGLARTHRAPRRTGEETRRAVIAAATAQIEASGLITVNVASVARDCDIHETLIYRHFRSRAGLLEETLGQMWDDHAAASRAAAEVLLDRLTEQPLDARSLAAALPSPGGADERRSRLLIVQIIAASATLPRLRSRMAATQQAQDAAIEQALERSLSMLPDEGRSSTARALRALITGIGLGFAIGDLDPERSPTDSELRAVWADLIGHLVDTRPYAGAYS
jgi:AcrR family transcriptional regulator